MVFPSHEKFSAPMLDMEAIDFFSVLDRLDDGIIISDFSGNIIFYNTAQSQIDEISPEEAKGMKVTEIYELNKRTSMVMQCMQFNASFKNKFFFYRTYKGKVVNTITSVYPLYSEEQINGAICFVKNYEQARHSGSLPPQQASMPTNRDNGTKYEFSELIGSDQEFRQLISIAQKTAASSSPIMIMGETGTGKELIAQAIHNHSPRRDKKFVALNCAAIPRDLLEGMLFGTDRGAFTGALDKPGLFEIANGSTLFLDELLAMPTDLQAKLLRVLQEKRLRRVGSIKEIPVDIKIISSINQDPRNAIKNDLLRPDLYYRLGVVMIKLPPLRSRPNSLNELADHFVTKYNARLSTNINAIDQEVLDLFKAYHWPGNIRELEHLIEGAMNMVDHDETLRIVHFGPSLDCLEKPDSTCHYHNLPVTSPLPDNAAALEHLNEWHVNFAQTQKKQEEAALKNALLASGGNVSQAARELGISRQSLHYKMKKYQLRRSEFLHHDGTT